jgi:hypothetical protein
MKQLARVLARPTHSFLTIAAVPAGANKLFLAVDAIVNTNLEFQASAILEITLGKKLGIELVYETDVSAADYVYEAGWHGLALRTGIAQIVDGVATVTPVGGLGEKGSVKRIARSGDVFACGVDADGDGFVGKVSGERFEVITKCTEHYERSDFTVLHAGASGKVYVGGSWGAFFVGDATGFKPAVDGVAFMTEKKDPRQRHTIASIHEKADGSVMIGCRDRAALYRNNEVMRLDGVENMWVYAVAEHAGKEYWIVEDGMRDVIGLYTRQDAKLSPSLSAKHKRVNYRELPPAVMRAAVVDGVMAIAAKDRVHLFDGETWSQLKIQPDVDALVKRVPAGMKA